VAETRLGSASLPPKFLLTQIRPRVQNTRMKQRYHTIIKPDQHGSYFGWVEEIPGALTHGRSLDECREKLRAALQLMLETHRDDARQGLDRSCILEAIEIDLPEPQFAS